MTFYFNSISGWIELSKLWGEISRLELCYAPAVPAITIASIQYGNFRRNLIPFLDYRYQRTTEAVQIAGPTSLLELPDIVSKNAVVENIVYPARKITLAHVPLEDRPGAGSQQRYKLFERAR